MIPGALVNVFVSKGFDILVVNISRSCDMTVTKILSVEANGHFMYIHLLPYFNSL